MDAELRILREAITDLRAELRLANTEITLLRIAMGEQKTKLGFMSAFYGIIGGAIATATILIARFLHA